MEKLLAFHGDPKIRAKYLRRVREHREADQIVQGTYGEWGPGESNRGCAVGCTLHGERHADYPSELGIPEQIAWLEDEIFENLPIATARLWPERFLSAIRPGADLSLVWPKFAVWLLTGLDVRGDVKSAVDGVIVLYQEWIDSGRRPSKDRFSEAAWAAVWAAAWAAWAAAWAALAAGAAGAAWAARAAAESDFWMAAADKLIELLKAA